MVRNISGETYDGLTCIVVCFQVVFFTASGDVELSKAFYQAFMCPGRGLVPTQAGSFALGGLRVVSGFLGLGWLTYAVQMTGSNSAESV